MPDFGQTVTEVLGEWDEETAELFLMDERLTEEQISARLPEAIRETKITPVLCGCAKLSVGVRELMNFIALHMPSAERRSSVGLCGVIFKIEHDKVMGKVSHVRLFGGKIVNRDEVELIPPADAAKTEETPSETV